METLIKNVHLINGMIGDEEMKKLEHGALQHRKFARITFKIISVKDSTIKVQVTQAKSPQQNYLDEQTLILRGKELFGKFFPSHNIIVNAIPFRESEVEVVTPEYIRHFMTVLKIKAKDIAADTGLDKTNISTWMNGTREMSQPIKAMFFYYFFSKSVMSVGIKPANKLDCNSKGNYKILVGNESIINPDIPESVPS